ncbi:nickel pincer cofactor biosynthesis protein LarC [Halomicrococcus gelatinilyticus]|uniref:nickel pincer cofactor biosynthesis protein LarC n=1 Tax=Halomicrococcus gelatinilyticus TaxID=1702103 RepID=UPI002E10901F
MRTLAFDGRMGASGDMILAALLDAGADPAALAPVEDALGVEYATENVVKNGIASTSVTVLLDREDGDATTDDGGDEHDHSHSDGEHDHEHGHSHSHGHEHEHDDHSHSHDHHHDHAEGAGPQRTYREVVELVESMDLDASVEADAKAVFEILGRAEASVHDTDLESTHFHEVGADDAIADVVGAALLLDDLGVERVVTTPLSTGGGAVEMSHGIYPVPAPAVVEIAQGADWSLDGGPVEAELLTPTGAAILAHFADGVETLPGLDVEASGYGAGGYDFAEHPNVLRVLVGDGEGGLVRDDVTVLETNLDDAPPEVLGGLQETLADAGARDVSIVPTTMKKSRPGHLVKVVARPEDAERVAQRLAEETGTLGVRETGASHRWIAEREVRTATVAVGGEERDVDVKVASTADGTVFDVSAEFDDALAVAQETAVPVREVMRHAEARARENL